MGGTRAIRFRLAVAAAFAVLAVWIGVYLQYRELAYEQARAAAIHDDLQHAKELGRLTVALARERGLSQRLLLSPEAGVDVAQSDVSAARLDVDALVAGTSFGPAHAAFVEELRALRLAIDARRADPRTAFSAHSALITDLNLSAARRLAAGMLAIGLPYEHLNALRDGLGRAGQVRGLVAAQVATRQGESADEQAVRRARFLMEADLERSASLSPDGLIALGEARWKEWDQLWQAYASDPAAFLAETDPDRWWSVATRAIDALQLTLDTRLEAAIGEADAQIAAIERRAAWAVGVMVLLGVITVALLVSTLARVMQGLGILVRGMDRVARHGDLGARVDDTSADEFGQIGKSVNSLVDSLEHLVGEKELAAQTDALTKLMNRSGLDRHLAARTNPERKNPIGFGLLVVDIDHFKRINDEFGHLKGDQVLATVASALRQAVRPDDIVGRWGGEEFLVVLNGDPSGDLSMAAEKVRQTVGQTDCGIDRPITVSIGATRWVPVEPIDDSFRRADAALYDAKAQGRNRVIVG